MGLFNAFTSLFSKRAPAEESWVLPGNEVTRAIESGRDLASYAPRPEAPDVERPMLPPLPTFELPPLDEVAPAPRIVISDDVVHGGPEAPALEPTEKPLEPKTQKKRWWRRAA